jgi:hypothetical protein
LDGDSAFVTSTDEAWSRQVGGVSPQHVGRLRRVFERFGDTHEQYAGLFWSHFYSALDWPDAEMWLQGAIDSGWSISQMRDKRWEAHGAPAELKPNESDIVATEVDEESLAAESAGPSAPLSGVEAEVRDTSGEETGAKEFDADAPIETDDAEPVSEAYAESPTSAVRPFENLPGMPDDLKEAFELFKLSILSHKISGWTEISVEQVLGVLESLKRLALAPAE